MDKLKIKHNHIRGPISKTRHPTLGHDGSKQNNEINKVGTGNPRESPTADKSKRKNFIKKN